MQCTEFTMAKKSDYPKRAAMVDTEMARQQSGTVGTRRIENELSGISGQLKGE